MIKYIYAFLLFIFLLFPASGCIKSTSSSNNSHGYTAENVYFEKTFIEISDKTDAFNNGYFQVIGRGEGDTKEMALLAARSVAQARLVEIIYGLEVERDTLVKNGKIEEDVISLKSKGFIKFASVCGEQYNPNTHHAEVCLKLMLKTGGLGDLVEVLIIK